MTESSQIYYADKVKKENGMKTFVFAEHQSNHAVWNTLEMKSHALGHREN